MNRNIIIVGVIAVALLAGAWYFGLIDLDSLNLLGEGNDVLPGADLQSFSNREIHTAICTLTGKDLPWLETNAFIDSLHIEMYGVDGESYTDVETYYKGIWTTDGYTVSSEGYTFDVGYTTYSGLFVKDLDGRGLIAGSGAGITSYYGYDTIIMVGHGPLSTWVSFVFLINSS